MIERLKELMENATPGPWEWELDGPDHLQERPILGLFNPRADEPNYQVAEWKTYDNGVCEFVIRVANAALIAEAINTLPTLLEAAEALREIVRLTDMAENSTPPQVEPYIWRDTVIDNAKAVLEKLK